MVSGRSHSLIPFFQGSGSQSMLCRPPASRLSQVHMQRKFLDPTGMVSVNGAQEYAFLFLFFKDFYSFMRDRGGWAETQAEGEAGSMQGARRGTGSRVPRITPWAEGSAKPLSPPGCPKNAHCIHLKGSK